MSESRLAPEFYLEALRREGAAFRTTVSPDVLASPVPSCPDWNLEQLVGHLGAVFRRGAGHLSRGTAAKPQSDVWEQPPAGEAVIAWWEDSLRQLVAEVESVDPAAPAWNWSIQEPVARFWFRRMAIETAIHRWDAELAAAAGYTEPIEPELAADGVAEALDTWLSSGRRVGPTDLRGVVNLIATDADAHWAVRLRGEGFSVLDTDTVFDEAPHAQTAVSGSASDLLLAIWGRVPFSVLTVEGNPELPRALLVG
jgi:uncharacterized protein (TIGR03083 family)